jgi:hypothetical protein
MSESPSWQTPVVLTCSSHFLPKPTREARLIELRPESLEELRKRLRDMSDLELRRPIEKTGYRKIALPRFVPYFVDGPLQKVVRGRKS